MSPEARQAAGRGAFAAGLCHVLWGLVPLYWKQLAGINSVELIAHRIVWSLVFLIAIIAVRADGGFAPVRTALGTTRSVGRNLLSASLITVNWLVYVWSVNAGYVIECSLGYFLVPLVNVAMGRLVLHEQLRPAQWAAIGCATVGVLLQVVQLGHLPVISLTLAATFGTYGLLRKKSPLGPLTGLTVETALLAPLAIGFLLWRHFAGVGALGRVDAVSDVLILSSGVVTSVPLLLFAYGARRIRLSTLGLLHYITPTVLFGLGVWVYREPFSPGRAATFAFIWCGLAFYTADNLWTQRPR